MELSLLQHHKPYKLGELGSTEYDCAGLAWYVYHYLFGIDIFYGGCGLSTTTRIMTSDYGKLLEFSENASDKNIDLIGKGDIVFFHRQSLTMDHPTFYNRYPGHCGIYLGEQKFIHASLPSQKVIISNFNYNPYWHHSLVGAKDIVSDEKVLVKIKNTSNY